MAEARITVPLSTEQRIALVKMAEQDFRDFRDEVRFLIVEEARRRGLLPSPSCTSTEKQIVVDPIYTTPDDFVIPPYRDI